MELLPAAKVTAELDNFIAEGGFPKTLDYTNVEDKKRYTQGVISEIFEKDIRRRVKIRSVSVFNTIQAYIINNFGATTSLTNILEDLHKSGSNITRETLNRYIQVAMTIMNNVDTENREFKPLESIRDNYPKYVMTRNDMIQRRNGIVHANIGPFMKDGKSF